MMHLVHPLCNNAEQMAQEQRVHMPKRTKHDRMSLEDTSRTMELFPNGHAKFMTPEALRKLNMLREESTLWESSGNRAVVSQSAGKRFTTIADFQKQLQNDENSTGAANHTALNAGEEWNPMATAIQQWQVCIGKVALSILRHRGILVHSYNASGVSLSI